MKKTYVTLISTDNYLPGVLALNEALRRAKSAYPLLVACSATVSPAVEAVLRAAGMGVTKLAGKPIQLSSDLQQSSGHWSNTFDKVQLFGLTEFDKLVYVDSDMLILDNIDELFDKPHMSAVAAGRSLFPDWNRLNSGLMVIEPDRDLPGAITASLQKALDELSVRDAVGLGDQDLINAFYSTWPTSEELHLDEGYNVFQSHLDGYVQQHGYHVADGQTQQGRRVKIVHFVGRVKPWMSGAAIRHQLDTLRRGKLAKWERRLFSAYRKLLKESSVPAQR